MHNLARLFCLACLFAASSVVAKDVVRLDPSDFAARRAEIENELKGGERYSELTLTQREDVTEALDRMQKTLTGVDSVQALDDKAKTQLMNDQELVNTTLTRAEEDSRLVCKQERATGSHRLKPKCMTVGEIRRAREAGQESARRLIKPRMRSPGN